VNSFAQFLGYGLMVLAGLSAFGFLLFHTCLYVWKVVIDGLHIFEVSDAVKEYRKTHPKGSK
jgi:hypothetical protein